MEIEKMAEPDGISKQEIEEEKQDKNQEIQQKPKESVVKKKVTDSEFGPGTILSDDEVDNYSGDDSEAEDVVQYRKKDEKDDGFFQDFEFTENAGDYMKDPWDQIIKMIKPRRGVSITETIARVRKEEHDKWKAEKAKKNENGEEDDDDDDDLDDSSDEELLAPGKDELRDRESEAQRKARRGEKDRKILKSAEEIQQEEQDELRVRESEAQRKARRGEKDRKILKSAEEIQQEERDKEFFEDAPPAQPDATFLEMNFSRSLLKAIDRMGYDQPTPIQAATIPVALLGRDICGCAATGTGKTAAYMLPILERLLFKPSTDVVTRVLVLVPTRELGVQVFQVAKDLSLYSHIQISLSVGGMDLKSQETELKKAPDIVIATPGRLIDHLLNTPNFNLESIEILVLDEADRMLDDSFAQQMGEIIKQCSGQRQTMLFSATMTSQVKQLATVSLKNPIKVFVNENTDVARNLRQEFIRIRQKDEKTRPAILAYLVSRAFRGHCMVFVATKVLAHQLNILLGLHGIKSGELHGDLKQGERLMSLKKFKDEEIDVLIATDVAARGLDIKGVKTVINYTMPRTYKRYVHRVGRTARAGHAGRSVSMAGDKEFTMLREIKRYSKSAMFERRLVAEILNKYITRLQKLMPAVQRVLKEEKEQRILKRMEANVVALENKVKHTKEMKKKNEDNFGAEEKKERTWFLSKEDIVKDQTKKQALTGKRVIKQNREEKKKAKREKRKRKPNVDTEQREINKSVRVGVLQAKKANKMGRLKAVNDDEEPAIGPKKSKKKPHQKAKNKKRSNFDAELTNTDSKTVKKLRNAGPSYIERKQEFELENPGKKFKPGKKQKR